MNALLLLAVLGCHPGDDTADSDVGGGIHLTGQVADVFMEARRDGEPPVDRVIAIPNRDGNMDSGTLAASIVFELGDDGLFDIEVSTESDWILVLEASTGSTPSERLRGYVTVGAASGSMLSFPIQEASADVPLGLIEPGADGEAVTETTLEEASGSFALSVDTLEALAQFDDIYRLFGNAWVNYDPEAGTDWMVTTNGNYYIGFAKLLNPGSPTDMRFSGFDFRLETNDPGLDYSAVCGMTSELAVTPPYARVDGKPAYDADNPFVNTGMLPREDDPWMCLGDHLFAVGNLRDGRTQVAVPAESENIAGMAQGWWSVAVDGTTLAEVDLTTAHPFAWGQEPVPIPQAEITLAGNGEIEAIDVSYHRYDRSLFQWVELPVADVREILQSVTVMDIHYDLSVEDPPTHLTKADWVDTLDLDGTVGNPVTSLEVSYRLGPTNHHFVYTQREFCGDGVIDGDERICDGDDHGGETCASLGFAGGTLACTGSCFFDTSGCEDGIDASWVQLDAPSEAPQGGIGVVLDDGRLLFVGGSGTTSTQLFDPVARTWSTAGSTSVSRWTGAAAKLADGRVLISGGSGTGQSTDSAEIFDPDAETWSPAAPMTTARVSHTLTTLPDGRVLAVGGKPGPTGAALGSAEIWSPDTEEWSATLDAPSRRSGHTAVAALSGSPLVAGGRGYPDPALTVEGYHPTNNDWFTHQGEQYAERLGAQAYFLPTRSTTVFVGGTCGTTPCPLWQHSVYEGGFLYPLGAVPGGFKPYYGAPLSDDVLLVLDSDADAQLYFPAARRFHAAPSRPAGCGTHVYGLENGEVVTFDGAGTCLFTENP